MFSKVGASAYKPGLERSFQLAEFYNNPQTKFKSIHVAGTNGKGSVCNMIASTLQTQGYKVGLYTSPHIIDFRERIRINGEMISEQDVVKFIKNWKEANYKWEKPSFFELTMMMAFDWFAQNGVDFAVIETGLGGRLDSTNIISPLISIITNISKDHTQFLGDTLEKIAEEKAGIIKPGIPAVIGETDPVTEWVFLRKCASAGAPLKTAYKYALKTGQDIVLKVYNNCSLKGDYQVKNIKTALCAIDELRDLGVNIEDSSIANGFSNIEKLTGFRGRWTKMGDAPIIICDAGHNEAGLKYNIRQLQEFKVKNKKGNLRFILGFASDKDLENIIQLFPDEAYYYLTQARIPRALPYHELMELFKKTKKEFKSIEGYQTVTDAIKRAKDESSAEDIIYIGGSTYILGEAFIELKMKGKG